MTTILRYHPVDDPVPPGWIESTPAADMAHHGAHSRIIRLVDAAADQAGEGLAVNRQEILVSWPSAEEFWP